MKIFRKMRGGAAAGCMAGVLLAPGFWSCDDHSHEPPTVRILQPAQGDTVSGPFVTVKVQTTNFSYGALAPLAKIAGMDDAGHIHIYLDGEPEVDASADRIDAGSGDSVVLRDLLPSGPHFLFAQGSEGVTHAPIPGMRDTANFIVR